MKSATDFGGLIVFFSRIKIGILATALFEYESPALRRCGKVAHRNKNVLQIDVFALHDVVQRNHRNR